MWLVMIRNSGCRRRGLKAILKFLIWVSGQIYFGTCRGDGKYWRKAGKDIMSLLYGQFNLKCKASQKKCAQGYCMCNRELRREVQVGDRLGYLSISIVTKLCVRISTWTLHSNETMCENINADTVHSRKKRTGNRTLRNKSRTRDYHVKQKWEKR